MRERDPGVKVVLCSGYNEVDVAKDFPHATLSGFLQKPYTFQMLKDVVQQALARTPTSSPARSGRWRSVRCSWRR